MAFKAPYDEWVIEQADQYMNLCTQGWDEFNWDDCECCSDYRTCEVLFKLDWLQFYN